MVSMRHPSRALAALGVYGISSGGVKVMSNGRGLAAVAAEINNNQENAAPPQVESAPAVAVPGDISAQFCIDYANKFSALADATTDNLPFAKRAREIGAALFAFAGKMKEREAIQTARKKRAETYAGYQG